MQLGILQETAPGERRVALTPASVPPLVKAGWDICVQRGAGAAAGFGDDDYAAKGARLVAREEAQGADVLAAVRIRDAAVWKGLTSRQILVAQLDPLGAPQVSKELAASGASLFALELVPRTTRAQSMDVLSSMATVAGYRAALLAAIHLGKMFPMMMTAAGTITPAKVLVLGAGVAGLQAIASAKRMGAVVSGYDVRPACREQVESLGGKFIELGLDSAEAEDQRGYAKAQTEDFARRQQAELGQVIAGHDAVITTAAIPGQRSPVLIAPEAVALMRPGSVIVDLAAERGGNCPLSKPDEIVTVHNVTILGPTNMPAEIPHDASLMFANNVVKFILNLFRKGETALNLDDDIVKETLVAREGEVVQPRVRSALGLEPKTPTQPEM